MFGSNEVGERAHSSQSPDADGPAIGRHCCAFDAWIGFVTVTVFASHAIRIAKEIVTKFQPAAKCQPAGLENFSDERIFSRLKTGRRVSCGWVTEGVSVLPLCLLPHKGLEVTGAGLSIPAGRYRRG